jgi:predicted nucleic acid-binding protein
MIAPVFVDANVLVYAVDQGDPVRHRAARGWRAALWKGRAGRISYQVLHEFYATVTRKKAVARGDARAEIRDLLAWRPAPLDAGVLERAWGLEDRYGLAFWDALIVASAQAASCRFLLTEDLQADQDFDGVVVVNPFLREPSSLGFEP